MKVFLISLTFIIGVGFVSSRLFEKTKPESYIYDLNNKCKLTNGEYKVIYHKEFKVFPNWTFEIRNDTLTKIDTNGITKYTIEWISKNRFRIFPTEKRKDSLNEIEKLLKSLGTPFFKLSNCKTNKTNFEYKRNEHITINEGKIIKKK